MSYYYRDDTDYKMSPTYSSQDSREKFILTTLASMMAFNRDADGDFEAERNCAVGWIERLLDQHEELKAERDALANRTTELEAALECELKEKSALSGEVANWERLDEQRTGQIKEVQAIIAELEAALECELKEKSALSGEVANWERLDEQRTGQNKEVRAIITDLLGR